MLFVSAHRQKGDHELFSTQDGIWDWNVRKPMLQFLHLACSGGLPATNEKLKF